MDISISFFLIIITSLLFLKIKEGRHPTVKYPTYIISLIVYKTNQFLNYFQINLEHYKICNIFIAEMRFLFALIYFYIEKDSTTYYLSSLSINQEPDISQLLLDGAGCGISILTRTGTLNADPKATQVPGCKIRNRLMTSCVTFGTISFI